MKEEIQEREGMRERMFVLLTVMFKYNQSLNLVNGSPQTLFNHHTGSNFLGLYIQYNKES